MNIIYFDEWPSEDEWAEIENRREEAAPPAEEAGEFCRHGAEWGECVECGMERLNL